MSIQDSTRRQFVGCVLTGLAVGLSARELAALPIAFTTGQAAGKERRYPIPATDSVNIDRATQIIIVRAQQHAYAFALACPHENAAVKWVENDHRFQCTRHDSRYQVDGTHISGRATRNMDRFPIRKDGSDLIVTVDRVFHSDVDPSGWAAANAAL